MEDRILPIIFFNLCGEMMYVILQRLEAQNISEDKTTKVIQDILGSVLNDQFVEELFKPQKIYTRSGLLPVFEKLVHSSIMRLNSNSMSKLYDLMFMVFKYQVLNCKKLEDILLVTLNHLDALRDNARPYPELMDKVKNVYILFQSNYSNLSREDYLCVYNYIEAFLEDFNVRVSVLMKLGLQLPSGEIVIAGNENVYSKRDAEEIQCGQCDNPNFQFEGERNVSLGTNIYLQLAFEKQKSMQSETASSISTTKFTEKELHGTEEMTLLTRLIGKSSLSCTPELMLASPDEEKLDLHDIDVKENCSFVQIDASQVAMQDLEKICSELDINVTDKNHFDVLELMDIAETQTK